MVRWVVGSILHGEDPLSYFSFQPVLHDWCNKGRGMCYPVCGIMHIKEPLLLIGKSSLCGGSGFPFSLSEWSFTICLTPMRLNAKGTVGRFGGRKLIYNKIITRKIYVCVWRVGGGGGLSPKR